MEYLYYCITGEGGFVQPSIQLWLLVTDRILAWIFNTFRATCFFICLIKFKSLSVKLGTLCTIFHSTECK